MGHHNRLFNMIAPIYALAYSYQKRVYADVIEKMRCEVDLTEYRSVLDVGCGTGALASVLNEKGLQVTAMDSAERMLAIASAKSENKGIDFICADALAPFPFERDSFDISTASFVAHGMSKNERKKMYGQLRKVAKYWVIIHDYNNNRSPLIDIAEWLEGGHYFDFIECVREELKESFWAVREVEVGSRSSWYICKV